MIRYLKHEQIDTAKWDSCIRDSVNGNIYGYSWYLDIVCEGWDALVEEDYRSVMPLTRKRKYLVDYLFPPFFTQQLGVFSTLEIDESLCYRFLNSIPSVFRFIEINLNTDMKWIPEDFKIRRNLNYMLDLRSDYKQLSGSYSENHRRNLKKASSAQLKLDQLAAAQDIVKLFRENRGRLIHNLQDPQYDIFLRLVEEAAKRNLVRTWMMSDQDYSPCAGVVFFESHRKGVMIFSAVNQKGRDSSAMHLLIDRYVHQMAGYLDWLDFEGSNNLDLARFYKGFGSTEFVYLQIRKNQLPPPLNWFKN